MILSFLIVPLIDLVSIINGKDSLYCNYLRENMQSLFVNLSFHLCFRHEYRKRALRRRLNEYFNDFTKHLITFSLLFDCFPKRHIFL